MTRPVRRALFALSAVTAVGMICAPMASADQEDDPCPLSMAFLCRMLPIAPELDGDVDLTQATDLPNPTAVPLEPPPPVASATSGGSG